MNIYHLQEKKEYTKEYFECCVKEWGTNYSEEKIQKKVSMYLSGQNNKIISVLILLDNDILIGFISLFKEDGEEKQDLSPWYATMYVKEQYRKKGYSKLLNNAILEEAKKLKYKRVYLKTDLTNYYEKFGAHYLEDLNNGEKLYYIDI